MTKREVFGRVLSLQLGQAQFKCELNTRKFMYLLHLRYSRCLLFPFLKANSVLEMMAQYVAEVELFRAEEPQFP